MLPQEAYTGPYVPFTPEWHRARYAWGLHAARSVGQELDNLSRNIYEEAIWRAEWKERYGAHSEPNRKFQPRHVVAARAELHHAPAVDEESPRGR